MTKPLPCPRCGKQAHVVKEQIGKMGVSNDKGIIKKWTIIYWYYVRCRSGHRWESERYNTKQEAVGAWNERPKGEK